MKSDNFDKSSEIDNYNQIRKYSTKKMIEVDEIIESEKDENVVDCDEVIQECKEDDD